MQVIYEDNHIIIVNKESGEIVQGDKTGDQPLSETVKQYIKTAHNKPGNVFLGVVHRLDRPVSGVVVFAKTSKALARLNDMFREGQVHKTYWAIYRLLACTDRYSLLAVQLLTGRHHQIRCQLSAMGCPIKGDLKYGAKRSNPDGSISLHARRVEFIHPVSKLPVVAEAPTPNDNLWREIATSVQMS